MGDRSPSKAAHDVTVLLCAWRQGDNAALERLTPLVYAELRRIAQRYMARERVGHTLGATALVHEAYLKLVDLRDIQWNDRAHFLAMSARLMRRILVDLARARGYQKRGGGNRNVTLTEAEALGAERPPGIVALDDALEALAAIDARKAKIVELRFFGGLSVEETAEVLDVSAQTVMRDWRFAKSWLLRELGPTPTPQTPARRDRRG